MKKFYPYVLVIGIFVLGGVLIANAQSSAVFTSTLRYGTTDSAEASKLQEFLIAEGYLTGTPNGMIYQTTSEAIKKFQRANNLSADGIVGPKSRAVLNLLYTKWKNPELPKVSSACSSPTIQNLINTTWPQPCNSGSSECGVRNTGSTQINANSCHIWAVLPTFDDSVTSVLNSAIANPNTGTITYTFPSLHTCRANATWTTVLCS